MSGSSKSSSKSLAKVAKDKKPASTTATKSSKSLREKVLSKLTAVMPGSQLDSGLPRDARTEARSSASCPDERTTLSPINITTASSPLPSHTDQPHREPLDAMDLVDRMLEAVDIPRSNTPSVIDDPETSIVSSIIEDAERRVSTLYTTPKRNTIVETDSASKQANIHLQKGKAALEAAGNMKRECKLTALDCMHFLYETILSLAESRARHINNLEKERTRHAVELVRVERAHSKELKRMWEHSVSELSLARTDISGTLKEAKEIRLWLGYETEKPFRGITEVGQAIRELDRSIQLGTVSSKEGGPDESSKFDVIRSEMSKLTTHIGNVSSQLDILRRTVETLLEKASMALEVKPEAQPQQLLDRSEIRTVVHEEISESGTKHELGPILELCGDTQATVLTISNELRDLRASTNTKEITEALSSKMDDIKRDLSDLRDTAVETTSPIRLAVESLRQEIRSQEPILEPGTMRPQQPLSSTPVANSGVGTLGTSYKEALLRPRYPIMVESADPLHSSSDVVQNLKEKVDVIQLGVGVSSLRKVRNQKVVINCDSERDRDALREAIQKSSGRLTVTQPVVKHPLLKLLGVANDLSNAKLEEAVFSQNRKLLPDPMPDDATVRVLRRARIGNNSRANVVLEVSPVLWNCLRDQELRIGYQTIQAVDQSPVVQCYRCLAFGHIARDCQEKVRCGYCSEEHDTRQCRNRNSAPRCVHCVQSNQVRDSGHPAYASECPEWRKWDRLARSITSYNC